MSVSEFPQSRWPGGTSGSEQWNGGHHLVAIRGDLPQLRADKSPPNKTQIRDLRNDYIALRRALLAEELEGADINSPLALLMNSIAERALDIFGVEGDEFLEWLETAVPPEISEDAGRAATTDAGRLADSVDELDGVLLSALEELGRLRAEGLEGAAAEAALADLWGRTFSAYAAVQEDWLERAFIRRGRAILDTVYPD